ncbi:MAG: histone H1 [Bacteroidia bacterium]
MEKYAKLKSLVISIEDDFSKFYDKGNKAAGTRARKAMQDIKVLAQDIRKEIQDMK